MTDISRDDVVSLIEAIADRPAPAMAHLVFAHSRSLFNWAIARSVYGLEDFALRSIAPGETYWSKGATAACPY